MIIMNFLLCVSAFTWIVYPDNMLITVNLALFACVCVNILMCVELRITVGCHASGAAHLCLEKGVLTELSKCVVIFFKINF